jgi:hypothetical protein
MMFLGLFSVGLVGCGEKAATTKETTVSTPGGTTTTTESKEVKQTGENPPAPAH